MTAIGGRIPLLRARIAIRIAEALEAGGHSPDALARRLNIPAWHHCNTCEFVPHSHINRLMTEASRLTGSPTFGIRAMEIGSFLAPGSVGERTADADTVGEALQVVVRDIPAYGSVRQWRLAESGFSTWICRDGPPPFEFGDPELTHFALATMVRLVRMGTGREWRPARVLIPEAAMAGLEDEAMFVGTQFTATETLTAVAVPHAVMKMPIRRPSGSPEPSVSEAPADNFAGSLRQVLRSLLGQHAPQIEDAAEIAGMTVRSLQRRPAREGVTYSKLVEEARYDAATTLLAGSDAKIIDVAYCMGYSDPAHFTRAFRRFAGVSPREYRKRHALH